jgi:hypothetical protein
VVKPFPFALVVLHRSSFLLHRSPVAFLHRMCLVAARMSSTPCLLGARYSTDIGHPCEPFSTLCAVPISAGRFSHSNKNSKDNFQCNQM